MASDRTRAAIGSSVFFVLAPGVNAGLVPWLITRWNGHAPAWAEVTGGVVTFAGTAMVAAAFAQFVMEGRGTPAPVAPTQELVVGGLYRWVRNPMYVGVAAAISGQAIMFASLGVVIWLALFVVAVTAFVMLYEEPTLRETFSRQYDEYAAAVPRWLPRVRPWRPQSVAPPGDP